MNKTNQSVFRLELVIFSILVLCTFFRFTESYYFLAGLLSIFALILRYLYDNSRLLKMNRKKVTVIVVIFAVLYVALFYTMGFYMGFYRSSYPFRMRSILENIIPTTIVIVAGEMIRDKLLLDQSKKSKVMVFLIGTLIDISLYLKLYSLVKLDGFLAFIGLIVFASIVNNILFTYISANYGKKPIILYKCITFLYVYFIPIVPNVYPYLRTFLRMIYPLIIYTYIEKYYYDDYYQLSKKEENKQRFSIAVSSVFILLLIGLISCKFLYGVLVIGSNSMSKTIEKGDIVFFQKTEEITKGDVIVFLSDDMRVVHRVIDMKKVNGEIRYYTKGDANVAPDMDYVTNSNLVGKVLFKVKYIGQPTLWLNGKFE